MIYEMMRYLKISEAKSVLGFLWPSLATRSWGLLYAGGGHLPVARERVAPL